MTLRQIASATSTALIVSSALLVAGLVVRREIIGANTQTNDRVAQALEPRRIADWERLLHGGHLIGSPTARVKVVLFSDYQCPGCRLADADMRAALEANESNLAVVLRHYPLANHAYAVEAALASECAAKEEMFEAYHERLFLEQQWIGVLTWRSFAEDVGISDLDRFDRCMEGKQEIAVVRRDYDMGRSLQLKGTPTLIVEGYEIVGALWSRLPQYLAQAFANSKLSFRDPRTEQ